MNKNCVGLCFCVLWLTNTAWAEITVVDRPDTSQVNGHYVSNRNPLMPSQWIQLPTGTIKPEGWARLPVKTTALRLTVQLQSGVSGGILEWQIK